LYSSGNMPLKYELLEDVSWFYGFNFDFPVARKPFEGPAIVKPRLCRGIITFKHNACYAYLNFQYNFNREYI
jgi:hypothetical protein